jgi:hypothetical protein
MTYFTIASEAALAGYHRACYLDRQFTLCRFPNEDALSFNFVEWRTCRAARLLSVKTPLISSHDQLSISFNLTSLASPSSVNRMRLC